MPEAPDVTCLTALVGISAAGSDCFPLPEGVDNTALTTSSTGFYLDSVAGLRFQVNSGNPARDLYPRLISARQQAALLLRTALQGRASFGTGKYLRSGQLGKAGNGTPATAGTLATLTLRTNYREEGALRITAVRLDATATVADVLLLLDGQPVGMLTSTNVAAQPFTTILIPLDGEQHTLEALLPPGVRPLQNQLFCPPCSGGGPWGQAVAANLYGVTAGTSGSGFILSVSEACTAEGGTDALCYAAATYPELRMYMGQALMYKAAQLFVLDLITEASANRYTMLEPKMLPALAEQYYAEYDAATKWLNSSAGLGTVQHPCFQCTAPSWHPTTNVTR